MVDIDMKNRIKEVLRNNLNKRINIIVLHGSSSSGKTTLASNLKRALMSAFRVYILSTDSFYKSYSGENKNLYDFDNPAAINWDLVHDLLKAFHDDNKLIPEYKYSFVTSKSEGPFYIKNPRPEIVIIEGIFAMNLFSKECFDPAEFDPYDPSKSGVKMNDQSYPHFGLITIRMVLCYEKMKRTRIIRDMVSRERTEERALFQFETQVWPSTKKWVQHPIFRADINLVNGSFNTNGYETLFRSITEYFLNSSVFIKEIENCIITPNCSVPCTMSEDDFLIIKDE